MIWIKEALKKFLGSMFGRGREEEVTEQEVSAIEPPLTESPRDSGKRPSQRIKRQERRRLTHAGAATARAPEKRKRKVAAEQKPKILPQRPLPRKETSFDPMDLLPIENLVPKDVDSHCVKMIILWGFIRPGRVEQFFGNHYRPLVKARKDVIGKGVTPEVFDKYFAWLVKEGIVLRNTSKKGAFLCSHNPHPDSVNPPAREIIRIAVRALRILSKR